MDPLQRDGAFSLMRGEQGTESGKEQTDEWVEAASFKAKESEVPCPV